MIYNKQKDLKLTRDGWAKYDELWEQRDLLLRKIKKIESGTVYYITLSRSFTDASGNNDRDSIYLNLSQQETINLITSYLKRVNDEISEIEKCQ